MVREFGRASVYLVVPPRRGDGVATISRCAAARELHQLRGSPDGITPQQRECATECNFLYLIQSSGQLSSL